MEIRLLNPDEIEVKVKSISEKGAVLLLYKTARVDMQILDETYGAMNWQCDYKLVRDNLYCGIGIREGEGWVWKWDCGIESREDSEGNEKKGEASDAFKRAGFKVGIGRELYTSPFIFANVETIKDANGKFKLKNMFERFSVQSISYSNKSISSLVIVDSKGNFVYTMKNGSPNVNKVSDTSFNTAIHNLENQKTKSYVLGLIEAAKKESIVKKWSQEQINEFIEKSNTKLNNLEV